MFTIGPVSFIAFAFNAILFHLFWRLGAAFLVKRNPDSALAKAMLFVG